MNKKKKSQRSPSDNVVSPEHKLPQAEKPNMASSHTTLADSSDLGEPLHNLYKIIYVTEASCYILFSKYRKF